ncbi:MAG: ATP-binding protein [Gammaproteobacteria bacterium AqS3]|nr:ATP-binding protein [Gammaproteobacteria bacterium AqS3]
MNIDEIVCRAGDTLESEGVIATIFGDAGVGKTTLAYKCFPNPLFIPVEDGMRAIPNAQMLPKPGSFDVFWEYLTALDQSAMEGSNKFESIVIDSLTALDEIVIAGILEKHDKQTLSDVGAWGAGYSMLKKTMQAIRKKLTRLQSNGVHIVLIAHAAVTKFSPPDSANDYDRWTLSLQKSTLGTFTQGVDAVMFVAPNVTVTTNSEGRGIAKQVGDERKITMHPTPVSIAKNRFMINESIPFILPENDEDFVNPLAFMFENRRG